VHNSTLEKRRVYTGWNNYDRKEHWGKRPISPQNVCAWMLPASYITYKTRTAYTRAPPS